MKVHANKPMSVNRVRRLLVPSRTHWSGVCLNAQKCNFNTFQWDQGLEVSSLFPRWRLSNSWQGALQHACHSLTADAKKAQLFDADWLQPGTYYSSILTIAITDVCVSQRKQSNLMTSAGYLLSSVGLTEIRYLIAQECWVENLCKIRPWNFCCACIWCSESTATELFRLQSWQFSDMYEWMCSCNQVHFESNVMINGNSYQTRYIYKTQKRLHLFLKFSQCSKCTQYRCHRNFKPWSFWHLLFGNLAQSDAWFQWAQLQSRTAIL